MLPIAELWGSHRHGESASVDSQTVDVQSVDAQSEGAPHLASEMWDRRSSSSGMRWTPLAALDKGASIKRPIPKRSTPPIEHAEAGLTLVELIIVIAILSLLATAALPIARLQVRRTKERELRADLWEMRAAIDKYKDAADKGAFQVKADSMGYPPDLETLVNGVDVQDKKVRFLRKIPVDPMTGNADWGFRSNQDDADSDSYGGQNIYDVHSKSTATAMDGTRYATW
ncbi:type II secretion system protein [Edaphobacter sp.]|uniref:type II secretion system protein n=1 Tax=Edaphobacter sp. TaxID=1934404 RepID=UPI00345C4202